MPKFILYILIALSIQGPAFAQKATADPNISHTPAAVVESGDVIQKVTYEAQRKPVREIIDDLSKLTNIKLYAGSSSQDWQVRDCKMNIFAKDIPLAALMNSIARVMKFRWVVADKNGIRSYRSYADRKALLAAEARKQREDEKREKKTAEQRQRMVTNLCRIESISPEELQKLKQENPVLYADATDGRTKFIARILQECPAAKGALLSGEELILRPQDLSPAARLAALGWIKASGWGNGGNSESDEELAKDVGVQFNRECSTDKLLPGRNAALGDIAIDGKWGDWVRSFNNPESKAAVMMARNNIRRQEGDEDVSLPHAEWQAARLADANSEDFGEQEIQHQYDHSLDKKIKMKPEKPELPTHSLAAIEAALADASGFSIVSDSFVPLMSVSDFIGGRETKVSDILDWIADNYHYNWDKRGPIIEMRDRNWCRKRCAQIPDAQIAKWRDNLKKNGSLEIDDLVEIAQLTMEQLVVNLANDDDFMRSDLSYFATPGMDASSILQIYGALAKDQQATVFSTNGLNLGQISPDVRKRLEKRILRRSAAFTLNDDSLALRAMRIKINDRVGYAFTVSSSTVPSRAQWEFKAPKYKEQKKK